MLWENVAYLASDEGRARRFALLKRLVGTQPSQILAAPQHLLREVASPGALAADVAGRLRQSAYAAQAAGGLDSLASLTLSQARKVLRGFPGIGRPGADKILLLAGAHPVPALESNGVRVLTRLGLVTESKGYAATYSSAIALLRRELAAGFAAPTDAHLLLRRHGQEVCRRSEPLCELCPLKQGCAHFIRGRMRS